jgi:hypothetical protein
MGASTPVWVAWSLGDSHGPDLSPPLAGSLGGAASEAVQPETVTGHAVRVGHGRVHERLAQSLAAAQISFVVAGHKREKVKGLLGVREGAAERDSGRRSLPA